MGITDIVLLIIIGVFGVKGYFRGFVAEAFGLLGLIVAYIFAFLLYEPLAEVLVKMGVSEGASGALGYVIAFIGIFMMVYLLGILTRGLFKKVMLGWVDSMAGGIFGAMKSVIVLGLFISLFLSFVPQDIKLYRDIKNSKVAGQLSELPPYLFDVINKIPDHKKHNPFL